MSFMLQCVQSDSSARFTRHAGSVRGYFAKIAVSPGKRCDDNQPFFALQAERHSLWLFIRRELGPYRLAMGRRVHRPHT